ncbi:hypothetical protein ACFYT3_22810 [Nocardia amikacinitolerans]|uniref:hypothetical protein n=1 Tax=Nocardia amikacinitolerans TaxID=756689 RepID=UPI0020A3E6E2|nr:hypothetical protein [Nocardia amikacinitolerans]MCP2291821.1 Mce-associated membrane protein [Nocardia amikacinitolerans]
MPAEDIESGASRDENKATTPEQRASTSTVRLDKKDDPAPAPKSGATVSIPVSSVLWGAAVAVLAVLTVLFGVLWWSAKSDLDEQAQRAADDRRAEQVATDYAVGAATVNYQDINAWIGKLKANTTPQLANKFDATAPKLEQILVPLKWTSTASPISAKVVSEENGVYKVNVFVNVSSTNAQSPEGAQTTVTYNVTLDENSDWKITDVGGTDGALPLN